MPIIKEVAKPNGLVLKFHKIMSMNVDMIQQQIVAHVAGWPTVEAHDAGQPLDWMWTPLTIPFVMLGEPERALVELDGSPFLGGLTTSDKTGGLEGMRMKKTAEIAARRDQAEFGNFRWGEYEIAADMKSRTRILNESMMALIARSTNEKFESTWRLVDNTEVVLDAKQMLEMAWALAVHTRAVHEKTQMLKRRIESADESEIQGITWFLE